MSTFAVKVRRVDAVEKHPKADRLTINRIGEFTCISNLRDDGTPRYAAGDLVVYIPEAAIVPEWVLKQIGFWDDEKNRGMLSGSGYNRVKAVRLREVYSEGILVKVWHRSEEQTGIAGGINYVNVGTGEHIKGAHDSILLDDLPTWGMIVEEGQDVAEALGIVKYEPPIPTAMAGQVCSIVGKTLAFDIESIQNFPDVIPLGTEVIYTEKLHGTFCQIGIVPGLAHPELTDGDSFTASKGLGGKGLVFKDVEENVGNLYLRTVKRLGLFEKLRTLVDHPLNEGKPVYLLGEIYGEGVQDFGYGVSGNDKAFAAFAIFFGNPATGNYLEPEVRKQILADLDIPSVPWLYRGPFTRETLAEHTNGTSVRAGENGDTKQIREGVVVEPVLPTSHPDIGRYVRLKSVSEAYKLRKGDVTEYQ